MIRKPLVDEQRQLLKGQKDITIVQCSVCHKIRDGKFWQNISLDSYMKKKIRTWVKAPKTYDVQLQEVGETITIVVSDGELHEEYNLAYKIEQAVCQTCSKQANQSADAIVQLRNAQPFVIDELRRIIEAQYKDNRVVKLTRDGYSYDIHITDKSSVRTIVNQLQKKFGGRVKFSGKLTGYDHQKSTELQRISASLTLYPFEKNDLLYGEDGNYYAVKHVAKLATLVTLKGTEKKIDSDDIMYYRKLQSQPLTISKLKPALCVLHPQTYEEVKLRILGNPLTGGEVLGFVVGSEIVAVNY